MITHYLKYRKVPDRKTRFDLFKYSEPIYNIDSFKPLVKPFIYVCRNPHIKANTCRKSDIQVSWNGNHLTSVYFFDTDKPELAYGDIINSDDLIIFLIIDDIVEMFILKGKKNFLSMIVDILIDNELNQEIEIFRNRAIFKHWI
jgi:hypothetical protein